MPNDQGAPQEQHPGLAEVQAQLDRVLEKAVQWYGSEAVATMLVDLAGKYRDVFGAEVSRALADWNMEHGGHA